MGNKLIAAVFCSLFLLNGLSGEAALDIQKVPVTFSNSPACDTDCLINGNKQEVLLYRGSNQLFFHNLKQNQMIRMIELPGPDKDVDFQVAINDKNDLCFVCENGQFWTYHFKENKWQFRKDLLKFFPHSDESCWISIASFSKTGNAIFSCYDQEQKKRLSAAFSKKGNKCFYVDVEQTKDSIGFPYAKNTESKHKKNVVGYVYILKDQIDYLSLVLEGSYQSSKNGCVVSDGVFYKDRKYGQKEGFEVRGEESILVMPKLLEFGRPTSKGIMFAEGQEDGYSVIFRIDLNQAK